MLELGAGIKQRVVGSLQRKICVTVLSFSYIAILRAYCGRASEVMGTVWRGGYIRWSVT